MIINSNKINGINNPIHLMLIIEIAISSFDLFWVRNTRMNMTSPPVIFPTTDSNVEL